MAKIKSTVLDEKIVEGGVVRLMSTGDEINLVINGRGDILCGTRGTELVVDGTLVDLLWKARKGGAA